VKRDDVIKILVEKEKLKSEQIEMVAMRVLNKKNIVSGLEQLGFYPEVLYSTKK